MRNRQTSKNPDSGFLEQKSFVKGAASRKLKMAVIEK
jgi:hypothetical protein